MLVTRECETELEICLVYQQHPELVALATLNKDQLLSLVSLLQSISRNVLLFCEFEISPDHIYVSTDTQCHLFLSTLPILQSLERAECAQDSNQCLDVIIQNLV